MTDWKERAEKREPSYWPKWVLDLVNHDFPEGHVAADFLKALIDFLEDEAPKVKWFTNDCADITTAQERLLEAEVRELREALRKYGKHQDQCGMLRMVCPAKNGFGRCVCGLDEALRSPAEPTTKPKGEMG